MVTFRRQRQETARRPGPFPAFSILTAWVVECFLLTQVVFGFDLPGATHPSSPQTQTGSRLKAQESRYDAERVFKRNQRARQIELREKDRQRGRQEQTQKAQEIEQGVQQDQQIQQEIAGQEKQQADQIYSRTTGLDSYSIDIDGGFWRSHLGLTAEGINVLAGRDLYGNESRGHYYEFKYNTLFNVEGITQDVADAAGNLTHTVVSGITYVVEYFRGIAPKDTQNLEGARDVVTTSFHPTGDSTTRTEIRDLQYQDNKVVAQKATTFDLTGPSNPIRQEVSGIAYDGDENVTSSHTVTTDLVTGAVTETEVKNQFSGHTLLSGVTKNTTREPITNTLNVQTLTQKVSYEDGRIKTIEVRSTDVGRPMNGSDNPTDDVVTTTETEQVMGFFKNIPLPVLVKVNSVTQDNVAVQTTRSSQQQLLDRDQKGNLLSASAAENRQATNADGSVKEETTSDLKFTVLADQPYLIRQTNHSTRKDDIEEITSVSDSTLTIQVSQRGKILSGEETGSLSSANLDRSRVSASEFKRTFVGSEKVNGLGLVRQTTRTTSENTIEEAVTVEDRIYTQTLDGFNRILGAGESFTSHSKVSNGSFTDAAGETTYAVSTRTLQPYAVSSLTKINGFDYLTESVTQATQATTITSDAGTGRALSGVTKTENVSEVTDANGKVLGVYTTRGVSEETLVGLSQANGLGLVKRVTTSQTEDLLTHIFTDREEEFVQEVNPVGKVLEARGTGLEVGRLDGAPGTLDARTLIQTDYTIIGNEARPIATRTLQVTVDLRNHSYRVFARADRTRYDPFGRILEIKEKDPGSGYQVVMYKDVTVSGIPDQRTDPEALFHDFFGVSYVGPSG